jgi:hypothetical protein
LKVIFRRLDPRAAGPFRGRLITRGIGAPAAVVARSHYGQLMGATIFSAVVFGEFSDLWTWVAAAIIIASGPYVLYVDRTRGLAMGKASE